MFSARIIFSLGIIVGLFNMALWATVIKAQLEQFHRGEMLRSIKVILLTFGFVSLASNIIPVWLDIYRLYNNSNPTNIFYAYVMNSYIYRTTTAIMFYLIYKY